MNADLFKNFDVVQKKSRLVCIIIIALMMASAAISWAQVIGSVPTVHNFAFLPIFCGLASLAAFHAQATDEKREARERLLFYLAEWVTILIVLKICLYLWGDPSQLVGDLAAWESNFFNFFYDTQVQDGGYILCLIAVAGSWLVSFLFAHDLNRLQLDEDELFLENHEAIERDRRGIRARMVEIILAIGAATVFLTAGSRFDLSRIGIVPTWSVNGPVINVVIYFLLAMMFLSQTQFDYLRGTWMWGRAPVTARLGGSWLKYGLIFFALISVLAYLLPTRYTVGILDLLRLLYSYLTSGLLFILLILLSPFLWLMNLLVRLFGGNQKPEQPTPAAPSPLIPPAAQPSTPIPWLEVLKSLLFWAFFIGVTGYFLYYYLSHNTALWKSLASVPLFRWLNGLFKGLFGWLRLANRKIVEVIKAGRDRLIAQQAAGPAGLFRPAINFRNLSPRQKVIFFYINLVQRGSQKGIPRKQSQTPYEYSQNLSTAFPEVQDDLQGITEAFIEARYTRHAIDPSRASLAQEFWRRVMEALKNLKKS
jgi:hypothetical protein